MYEIFVGFPFKLKFFFGAYLSFLLIYLDYLIDDNKYNCFKSVNQTLIQEMKLHQSIL